MKKVYAGEEPKTITIIEVDIKFSDEIGHWGDTCYYYNPKFSEFWDKVNTNPKYRYTNGLSGNLWNVMYFGKKAIENAEKGELGHSYVRVLTILSSNVKSIMISEHMHAILVHDPSIYPTTHEGGLHDLAVLCGDCAKYCGGTVEIKFSKKQRRFVWEDVGTNTITLGKGIRKWKVNEPRIAKRMAECDVLRGRKS